MGPATTPLWVTVLLAVLAPVLTLIGVLVTQRSADRRAEREAKLKIRHEREAAVVGRLNDLYDDLVIKSTPLISASFGGNKDWEVLALEYQGLVIRAQVLAPEYIAEAARRFDEETAKFNEAMDGLPPTAKESDGLDDVYDALRDLQGKIRADLRPPGADSGSTGKSRRQPN